MSAIDSRPSVTCTVDASTLSPLEVAIGLAAAEIARAFPHANEAQRQHMQRAIAELSAALRSDES